MTALRRPELSRVPPRAEQLKNPSPPFPALGLKAPQAARRTTMARARAGLRTQGPPGVGGGLRLDPPRGGRGHVTPAAPPRQEGLWEPAGERADERRRK